MVRKLPERNVPDHFHRNPGTGESFAEISGNETRLTGSEIKTGHLEQNKKLFPGYEPVLGCPIHATARDSSLCTNSHVHR